MVLLMSLLRSGFGPVFGWSEVAAVEVSLFGFLVCLGCFVYFSLNELIFLMREEKKNSIVYYNHIL